VLFISLVPGDHKCPIPTNGFMGAIVSNIAKHRQTTVGTYIDKTRRDRDWT
jgi:hypothetical protein